MLVKANGEIRPVEPKNGIDFSLNELKSFIGGGYVEVVNIGSKMLLVCDEEGKLKGLPFNEKATYISMLRYHFIDTIVGDVIFCPTELIK